MPRLRQGNDDSQILQHEVQDNQNRKQNVSASHRLSILGQRTQWESSLPRLRNNHR